MPVLQLRLGEVKQLAQGHTTSKWQRAWSAEFGAFTLNQHTICLLKGKYGNRVSYLKQGVAW